MTAKELEKVWKTKESFWMIPGSLNSSQKTLLKKAMDQTKALDGIIWFSSSGSTAHSGIKFFGHTRPSLEASARAVNQLFGISKKDRILNPLPLYHVGGFGTWLRARLAKCEWHDHSYLKWNPAKFHKSLEDLRITFTSLVPTQVYDLIERKLTAPKNLRAVVVGGGALNEDLFKGAKKLGWPLFASYGMTEFGSQIATGTASSPTPLKLLGHIHGIQQKGASTWISSDAACTYQLEMTKDGQFSLELKNRKHGVLIEDLLKVNKRTGTIKVLGRKSRVVKSLGELVSLDEVEREAGISGAAVIGCPHPREENELVLVVEKKSLPKSFSDIQSKVSVYNKRALGFQRIARIEFIDQLPRTDLGKIRYGSLRFQVPFFV